MTQYKVFDSTVSIYEAGRFTNDEGKEVDFNAGIKIGTPDMLKPAKISARALTALYFLIQQNKDIQAILKARCEEETNKEMRF